jgi:diacylglycerol kinase (ATP)
VALTVVANPSSGKGRVARLLPDVESTLRAQGVDARIVTTRDADDLRHAVRQAREAGDARVIVCGGDGSLHLAAQELAGGETALGIVPAGTGDDNARTLGISRKDVAAATRLAAQGPVSRIDLGRVVAADGTERVFLGVLSSGFDSLVNERANVMTWPSGNARYLVAILGELRTFRPVPYRAVLDGRSVNGDAMLVAVGNGVRKSTFLRVFPQVFSGTHVQTPYVSTTRASTIELDAPGQLAYADGERVGPLPAVISIESAALPVVRGPAGA